MKVVIAEPISKKLTELIEKNGEEWTVFDSEIANRDEFLERMKDAEIASAYSVKFDKEVLDNCPKLRYLAIPAVGAGSYVDREYAESKGITVTYCPGYNSAAVAEMAIGLAIDVMRKISSISRELQNGIWDYSPAKGMLLSGKKILLVGYGNIGKTIERLLGSWDVGVKHINSKSNEEELNEGIKAADVVFVCCSLNEKTQGLINAARISSMKKTAVLINVSRGAVVDEDALYAALSEKKILGAGLDVYSNEPLPGESLPENIRRFVELENTVCLTHIAASSLESGEVLGQMIYDNIKSCIDGNPINIFNN
ncbi:hypothetical protein KC992_00050 [Candidatus Saccharibacteria bacterium]|nr:hypothetical protein [Candidatus Saccharibacteria bacterium]